MTVIHELISVEADLKNQGRAMMAETVQTFQKRQELFNGMNKVLEMHDDDRQSENQTIEEPVASTIDERLEYMWKTISRAIDVTATKETANGSARADVVVGDTTVLTNVPVTVLLSLESYLEKLQDVYLTIPTLNPSRTWKEDLDAGKNIMVSNETKTFRTEKTTKAVVMYPATKEHPAQVEKQTTDNVIGTIITKSYSGLLSPAEKSALLDKITDLILAVKEARQRANTTEVKNVNLAGELVKYIHS